jgi:hypothetical protein
MSFDHDKAEHDRNVAERRRYRIVRLPGEVDENRTSIGDQRTHNGDTVHEYYDDVLIREHKLTIEMLAGYEHGREHAARKTPVFATRWCIDAASIAKLPKVIVDGSWSDPAAIFEAGRGCTATQPEGPWGVYAANFTDAYTLSQIEPLQAQYTRLLHSIQSTRDSLYVQERGVKSYGLFDNLPQVQHEIQSWIDECNAKIHTAQTHLSTIAPTHSLPSTFSPRVGMSEYGAQFVDKVARKLMLLYIDIGGKPRVQSGDTEFMRGVHACVSLFYEVVSIGKSLEWVRITLAQEKAELYIDNAVRQMLERYYKVKTSRDQYSTSAQTEFGILVGWVTDWQRKPVACVMSEAAGMDELENKLKDAIATKEMYHKSFEAELAERLKVQKLLEAERGWKELLQDSYKKEGIAKRIVEIELRQARWELGDSKKEIARLQRALAALEEENRQQVVRVKQLSGQRISVGAVDVSLAELRRLGGA